MMDAHACPASSLDVIFSAARTLARPMRDRFIIVSIVMDRFDDLTFSNARRAFKAITSSETGSEGVVMSCRSEGYLLPNCERKDSISFSKRFRYFISSLDRSLTSAISLAIVFTSFPAFAEGNQFTKCREERSK